MNATARRIAISAGVGSVFPILFLTAFYTGLIRIIPEWGTYLWPTSIMLMVLEGEGPWFASLLIIGASLLLNAILWVIAGFFVWWFFDLMRRVSRRAER